MQITQISKIFSIPGSHSAFTDIIQFQGAYYLGFMTGNEHIVNLNNKGVVLKSADGVNWIQSALFYCGIDTREPKFVVFDGKLWAYFFTITPSSDGTRMVTNSWYSNTADGINWLPPVQFAQEVKYWRPVSYQGQLYCVTHPKDPAPDRCCQLMRSADGIKWEWISDLPVDPMEKPNEASLVFDHLGQACILIRTDRGNMDAYMLRAQAPYTGFSAYNLHRRFGGPLVWETDHILYLGVRFYTDAGTPHTGIFYLDAEMVPHLHTVLPSCGDSSYMGITPKLDGQGYFISYYSSHEQLNGNQFSNNKASIYLATWQ